MMLSTAPSAASGAAPVTAPSCLHNGVPPPGHEKSPVQSASCSQRRVLDPSVGPEAVAALLGATALALMSASRARGAGRHMNRQARARVWRRQGQAQESYGSTWIDRRTTIVQTAKEAKQVVKILRSSPVRDLVHAVDTEVMGWEPGISPYDAGQVFCFSIYCGEGVDFGNGGRLFVDDLDANKKRRGLVQIFKEYFEDAGIKKVFHNYGFDRAQLFREGVDVKGFYADTMHMAQLQDPNRKSYKLSTMGAVHLGAEWAKDNLAELAKEAGATASTPELLHLSDIARVRDGWVEYSAFDTQATWQLYEKLKEKLAGRTLLTKNDDSERSFLDFYLEVHGPLLQVLVEMEEAGLPIDKDALEHQLERVETDLHDSDQQFRKWVSEQYKKQLPDDAELHETPLRMSWTYAALRHVLSGWGYKEFKGKRLLGLGLGSIFRGGAGQWPGAAGGSSSLTVPELLSALAGNNPKLGELGCGRAFPAVGQAGCEALFALSKVLRRGTKGCPNEILEEFWSTLGENERIRPGLFMSASGHINRYNPDPNQLRAVERDYPDMSSFIACSTASSTLVSASYVDLRTTLMVHLAQEPDMLRRLQDGDDVHAVTAYNIFPDKIREEVDRGCASLKPWAGENDVPCVREVFCDEYESAKQLNRLFSRMSANSWWDEQLEEVAHLRKVWREAYPQFEEWQEEVKKEARRLKRSFGGGKLVHPTLRGRHVGLDDFTDPTVSSEERWRRTRSACMAVQDAAMSDLLREATLRVGTSQDLKALGFRLIFQSSRSGSFVLEGPASDAEEALALLQGILQNPFIDGWNLAVPLQVEGRIGFAT